jgi:hypothetical protein
MLEEYKRRVLLPQEATLTFLSSTWIQVLKLHRYFSLANQIPQDFGVWERIPRSTTLPKEIVIPHYSSVDLAFMQKRSPQSFLHVRTSVLVGSLQSGYGVVPQPPCKYFGRRLQDHHLVELS